MGLAAAPPSYEPVGCQGALQFPCRSLASIAKSVLCCQAGDGGAATVEALWRGREGAGSLSCSPASLLGCVCISERAPLVCLQRYKCDLRPLLLLPVCACVVSGASTVYTDMSVCWVRSQVGDSVTVQGTEEIPFERTRQSKQTQDEKRQEKDLKTAMQGSNKSEIVGRRDCLFLAPP